MDGWTDGSARLVSNQEASILVGNAGYRSWKTSARSGIDGRNHHAFRENLRKPQTNTLLRSPDTRKPRFSSSNTVLAASLAQQRLLASSALRILQASRLFQRVFRAMEFVSVFRL